MNEKAWGFQRALADRIAPIERIMTNYLAEEGTPAYKTWEFNPFRDPDEYAKEE